MEEDDGDEAEGGLMVHRGAEVIMHGKGFPRDDCSYDKCTSDSYMYWSYVQVLRTCTKGVFL